MLSTLSLRDFAVAAEYTFDAFHNLFFLLLSQGVGAWFGYSMTNYFDNDSNADLPSRGQDIEFSFAHWEKFWLEFFAIFLFVFLTTKNKDVNHASFFTFLTVAAVFWFKPDAIFTPNRWFAKGMGWEVTSFKTYFNWIGAWPAYLITFITTYAAHYFEKYFF